MNTCDQTWHLAESKDEFNLTDFELQLWRVFFGFLRWQQECERTVNNTGLLGEDLSILHLIRMKNRPKSIADIARLLNRDDTFNIQYSIKKLIKMGLIKNVRLPGSKSVAYQMTPEGIENTNQFSSARRRILLERFIQDTDGIDIEALTKAFAKLKSTYDNAEHEAASQAYFNNGLS